MYAIIDIETTGGSPVNEKITEIAILLHNGERVEQEYVTLINPEKNIPYHISALTGITNEMVVHAPKFYDIAAKIVELTENRIFVAHNVTFDYNFIKTEFRNLGYNYQRDCLCTVKLSRKLIPGFKSYSLGPLCAELGITNSSRHRAAGDAYATATLFSILINKQGKNSSNGFATDDFGVLHPAMDLKSIKKFPEETGVYYLYNDKNEVIYVGKSRNIRDRVLTHLRSSVTRTGLKMKKEIASASYEITGSELIALLLESDEIKTIKPFYNRSQRYSLQKYCIVNYYNERGYLCFSIEETKSLHEIIFTCHSKQQARTILNHLVEEYILCQKLCGLYDSTSYCFHHGIGLCKGACDGKESTESYNNRALAALNKLNLTSENMYIVDKGRNQDETSIVKISNGRYIGFGYIDSSVSADIQLLDDCISPKKDNAEVTRIIKSYLINNKFVKVIKTK